MRLQKNCTCHLPCVLYSVLDKKFNGKLWREWSEYADYLSDNVEFLMNNVDVRIEVYFICFKQYLFFRQLQSLEAVASQDNISYL